MVTGSHARAYAYARDFLNLDVIAMTDHAPIGPGWAECLAVNEEFYEPGRFVTIPAWESSNAYGHANLYLRTPEVDGGTWHWKTGALPLGSDLGRGRGHGAAPSQLRDSPLNTASTARSWARRFTGRNTTGSFPTSGLDWWKSSKGRGNFEADALDGLLGYSPRRVGCFGTGRFCPRLALGVCGWDRQSSGASDAKSGRLCGHDLFPGNGVDPRGRVAGDGRALDLRDFGRADCLRLCGQRHTLGRGGCVDRRRKGLFFRQLARNCAD